MMKVNRTACCITLICIHTKSLKFSYYLGKLFLKWIIIDATPLISKGRLQMERYKFSDKISKSIVRGIMKGYKSYLHERKQKKEEMVISSAYAWVRGNHIDHHVAVECEPFGITPIPSLAGYSWGYLQFQYVYEKSLFLIKSKSSNKQPSQNQGDHYIKSLAKINRNINFTEAVANISEQLELIFDPVPVHADSIEDEIIEFNQQFERFYIITYTIDEQKRISDISLCLPHPDTYELYLVDSWNHFLNHINIDFTEEDFAAVYDDQDMQMQLSFANYRNMTDEKDEAGSRKS